MRCSRKTTENFRKWRVFQGFSSFSGLFPVFPGKICEKSDFPGALNRKSQENFGKIRFSWKNSGNSEPIRGPIWTLSGFRNLRVFLGNFLRLSRFSGLFRIFPGNVWEKSREKPGIFNRFPGDC